jgi:hypothetical protein
MPFDSFPQRDLGGDDPWWQRCKSCKRPINAHQKVEKIQLPHDPVHGADKVNGTYHAECAKPFLNLVRALDAMRRWG